MQRILLAIRLVLLSWLVACAAACAQGMPSGGFFPDGAAGFDPDFQFLGIGPASAVLDSERILSPTARFIATDNGPGGTYVLELQTVGFDFGGTNATTRQGGINNLLDAAAGATGDIYYRDGSGNVVRLPIGSANEVLTTIGGLPDWEPSASGAPANAQYLVLALNGTLTAERRFVTADSTHISLTDGGANADLTIDTGSKVVLTDTAQAITGQKTLTSPRLAYSATDGLLLRNSAATFDGKIVWPDWAANRTLTIAGDVSANFVMSESNLTINGTKTFSDLKLSGTTFKTAANTITVPAADDTLVNLNSIQTLGSKTLTSATLQTQLTLKQTTANYTITWADPAGARAYTVTDVGGSADFAMKSGTPTAGGVAQGDGNKIIFSGAGSAGQALKSGGSGTNTFGVLAEVGGGTNQSSYTAGDILVANDAGNLTKLAGGSDGNVLTYDSTGDPNIKWAGSGGGAPTDAQYLVLALNANLSAERRLVAARGLNIDDGGANGDATVRLITGAKGDWVLGSGATTAAVLAVGANGTIPVASSGDTTGVKWQAGVAWFGGDGSSGAVTKGTTADTLLQINATTFSQTASTTYTIDYVVLNCTSTATFSGLTFINAGTQGGPTAPNQTMCNGGGPGGGGGGWPSGGTNEGGGGGGGGFGNTGGNGGDATNGLSFNQGRGGVGGRIYPPNAYLGGSGGGSGADGGAVSGGAGGHGGGYFRVCAVGDISIPSGGTVRADGTNGSAGSGDENGGGGGGSGGLLTFYSLTSITLGGGIEADGGDGGAASVAAAGEGGGGAGGRVIRMSPSNTGAGTVTVNGGQGDGNTGNNGTDGGAGVSTSITGTPNLPVIAHVESSVALDLIARIHQFRDGADWGDTVELTHLEAAEAIAALHCRPGQFANLTATLMQGGVTYEELCKQTTFDCSGWADAIDAAARHETAWR